MIIDERIGQKLGVDRVGLFVISVEVVNFGRLLIFHMWNSPHEGGDKFKLVLVDCREIHWEVYIEGFDPPGSESPHGADVLGLYLGGNGREFSIMTDVFGIEARYADWELTVVQPRSEL